MIRHAFERCTSILHVQLSAVDGRLCLRVLETPRGALPRLFEKTKLTQTAILPFEVRFSYLQAQEIVVAEVDRENGYDSKLVFDCLLDD
jgi:hypothetical protein